MAYYSLDYNEAISQFSHPVVESFYTSDGRVLSPAIALEYISFYLTKSWKQAFFV